jgi:hypothetical protein
MRLYHLLSLAHAISNVALQRMKVARLHELNDPYELLSADLGKKEYANAFRAWKADLSKTKGLLCFSLQWENPLLWSHYAAKHQGICLGFDVIDSDVQPVKYLKGRIKARLASDGGPTKIDQTLAATLLYAKSAHWEYEKEYRMYVDLDVSAAEHGLHFFPFSDRLRLREVILGAYCEFKREALCQLLGKVCDSVEVIPAVLAARRFSVIKHKRFRNSTAANAR